MNRSEGNKRQRVRPPLLQFSDDSDVIVEWEWNVLRSGLAENALESGHDVQKTCWNWLLPPPVTNPSLPPSLPARTVPFYVLSASPLLLAQSPGVLAGHAPVVRLHGGLVMPEGRLVEDRKSLHRLRGQGLWSRAGGSGIRSEWVETAWGETAEVCIKAFAEARLLEW